MRWTHFEDLAFQVMGFTLELLWHPYEGKDGRDVMTAVRIALCEKNPQLERVFGRQPFVCRRRALTCAQQHYHPFNGLSTHEAAANGPLSEDFRSRVGNLRETATRQRCCCGMLFWTGGSAPLDYILLVVKAGGKTCYAAYGDAKHQSGDPENEATVTADAKRLSSR